MLYFLHFYNLSSSETNKCVLKKRRIIQLIILYYSTGKDIFCMIVELAPKASFSKGKKT